MLVDDLDVHGKRVLDIGCGGGGPGLLLAEQYGVELVGIDVEAALIEEAKRRARERSLEARTSFRIVNVTPGLPEFSNESFDVTMNCGGAFIHVEDKRRAFEDCWRLLKPGGAITGYEWMSRDIDQSREMREAFADLEPIFMVPLEQYGASLHDAGFVEVELVDDSDWYRNEVKDELEKLGGELYPPMCEKLGRKKADELVEFWGIVSRLCDQRELVQGYFRGRKST